jgi:glutamine amidotransferase
MADIAIIDSGGANLASLQYALGRLGAPATVTTDAGVIQRATHVILPGVGSANAAMARLRSAALERCIVGLTQPLLGICLGMQLLFEASDEGNERCLGVFPGRVERLASRAGFPVPHMGWNQLEFRKTDPLTTGIATNDYVYFVHGFAVTPGPDTVATTDYGTPLTAIVRRGNFCGTQFHPERSGVVGAKLIDNFLRS